MPIRRARVADIATLVELERLFPTDRLSARSFRRFIRGDCADVWAYETRNALLGNAVVLYRRGARVARLYSLVVAPRARGQGIGGALLAWVERQVARRGCRELRLEVRPENRRAQEMYRRRNYALRGLRAGFYDDGKAAVVMAKTFTPAARRPSSRRKASARRARAAGNAAMRTRRAATRVRRAAPGRRG